MSWGYSIKDLDFLAYFKGDSSSTPLEAHRSESGGGCEEGFHAIKRKMDTRRCRAVDLERATGVFDSVDDLSLAISLLAASPGRHHDPALQGPLRHPFRNGYRDLQQSN